MSRRQALSRIKRELRFQRYAPRAPGLPTARAAVRMMLPLHTEAPAALASTCAACTCRSQERTAVCCSPTEAASHVARPEHVARPGNLACHAPLQPATPPLVPSPVTAFRDLLPQGWALSIPNQQRAGTSGARSARPRCPTAAARGARRKAPAPSPARRCPTGEQGGGRENATSFSRTGCVLRV